MHKNKNVSGKNNRQTVNYTLPCFNGYAQMQVSLNFPSWSFIQAYLRTVQLNSAALLIQDELVRGHVSVAFVQFDVGRFSIDAAIPVT